MYVVSLLVFRFIVSSQSQSPSDTSRVFCRPFNRCDDKSADADIEVAFAWQSGHRPNQRGTNYGIDAAYPDSLQPALLRVYQWASREWHCFLGLDHSSGASNEPPQRKSTSCKRSLPIAEDNRSPKLLQTASSSPLISPPPCLRTQYSRFRQRSPRQDSNSIYQISRIGRWTQDIEDINDRAGTVTQVIRTDNESVQRHVFHESNTSGLCDAALETDSDFAPSEAAEAGQLFDECGPAAEYGFRDSFLDLRDLIRSPILGIRHYGKVPTFVTCKDALEALRRLPESLRSHIREIGISDQLTAADDYDNLDYAKEFGQYFAEIFSNVKVVTLPLPNDLTAGGGENENQYEFRLWDLHAAVVDAFKFGQFTELRFAHTEKYPKGQLTVDVYQMHNVNIYIKRMVVGKSLDDALRTRGHRLIQSQRYPTPPSPIDDKDTLFAILRAMDYDAWITAGYSIAFTEAHEWETGSVLALQRTPQTKYVPSKDCELAASWWRARCAFCLGNGFPGHDVMHAIAGCKRGGQDERHWNLGQQIFEKDVKAQKGCSICAFPGDSCVGQTQRHNSQSSPSPGQFLFGGVIYDVVVGLCQSECCFYREMLVLEMQADIDYDPSDRDIALWLAAPMPGKEEVASQFVDITRV